MNRKAQIAPFILVIAVILILAIAATGLIGEATFWRVRLANVADSALITAASGFCRGLNQLRAVNRALLLNYISTQVALLSPGIWSDKWTPLITVVTPSILTVRLKTIPAFDDLTESMPKDLRVGLIESALGGGLVDEPEPFLRSEVSYNNATGENSLDYAAYLRRLAWDGSHFTQEFRSNKSGNWYRNNLFSYAFNKSVDWVNNGGVWERDPGSLGRLSFAEPAPGYESFVRVELLNVPTEVKIKYQGMLLFYLFQVPAVPVPIILPGFAWHPYAWVKKIEFGSDQSFGLNIRKRLPFERMPFFNQSITVSHSSRIKVRGSVWSDFKFALLQD